MNDARGPVLPHRMKAILNLMEDGIYLSDRHGVTVWVNKAYEKLTELGREHFKGKNVRELVASGTFNRVLNPRIVKTGKPDSMVQEFGKDKKIVVLQGFPIFDDNGDVDLVVTFARDVTAMTTLREKIVEQRNDIERYQGRMVHMLDRQREGEDFFVSQGMRDLLQSLARIAETDATVLLLGETGVGKEVLARFIHDRSPRKNKIFMKVDCTCIAENLIESELFGYARGAFSGADSQGRAGYFEIADGGTVFLDEIGDLPLPMQSKLLRILQDREFMRVGSSKPRKADVRIIAATNRNLAEDSENGLFRRDLYYRLNVAKFVVPPLRERRGDIPLLARHFLNVYSQKYKKHMRLSANAAKALSVYPWPGNVRELQNMMLRLVITSEHEFLDVRDLPERVRGLPPSRKKIALPAESRPLKDIINDIEAAMLQEALERLGSVNKVAEFFHINRSTIFRKIHPEKSSPAKPPRASQRPRQARQEGSSRLSVPPGKGTDEDPTEKM